MSDQKDYLGKYLSSNESQVTPWGKMVQSYISNNLSAENPMVLRIVELINSFSREPIKDEQSLVSSLFDSNEEENSIRSRFALLFVALLKEEFQAINASNPKYNSIEFKSPSGVEYQVDLVHLEPTPKTRNPHPFGDLTEIMEETEKVIVQAWDSYRNSLLTSTKPRILCLDITRQGLSWLRPLETWQGFLDEQVQIQKGNVNAGLLLAFSSLDSNRISSVARGATQECQEILDHIQAKFSWTLL